MTCGIEEAYELLERHEPAATSRHAQTVQAVMGDISASPTVRTEADIGVVTVDLDEDPDVAPMITDTAASGSDCAEVKVRPDADDHVMARRRALMDLAATRPELRVFIQLMNLDMQLHTTLISEAVRRLPDRRAGELRLDLADPVRRGDDLSPGQLQDTLMMITRCAQKKPWRDRLSAQGLG